MSFSFPNQTRSGCGLARTGFVLGVLGVLGALVMAGSAGATTTICRVTPGVTNSGNGSNWSGQAMTLKTALSDNGCDEIWVKAGTYTPTTGTNRKAHFSINRNVKIYGGFAGTESQRDARNPTTNLTVLSGDLNGDDAADFAHNDGNSYQVVYVDASQGKAITASTVLDGFTISGGNADSYSVASQGAGLYCKGSFSGNCSLTISNVIFSGNSAVDEGGAMYNYSSFDGTASPTLSNIIFRHNAAGNNGGAMYNEAYNATSSPILDNVTFSDNHAEYGGGAMYNKAYSGTSSTTFDKVTFSGNTAGLHGGAVYIDVFGSASSNLSFSNVTFNNNTALIDGGAIYNTASGDASSPVFNNVTFSDNSTHDTSGNSGVMYNYSHDNSSPVNPVMTNVILWGNGTSPIVNDNGATAELQDSVLQGSCPAGTTCSGNMVHVNPLLGPLQDNGGATQTMLPGIGSPAIDAGNNSTCKATDQRGVARSDGHCDIGAVEVLSDLIFADGFELAPAP